MTRQSSLFEFEPETPRDIIQRVKQRARKAVDSREVGMDEEFIPASRLYDVDAGERVEVDWPTEPTEGSQ